MTFSIIDLFQAARVTFTSPTKSMPRLVILRHQESFQGVILVDTLHFLLSNNNPQQWIMTLLACYYAWDLNFPNQYQILTFLQLHFLEDHNNTVFRSSLLTKFEKKFQSLANDK